MTFQKIFLAALSLMLLGIGEPRMALAREDPRADDAVLPTLDAVIKAHRRHEAALREIHVEWISVTMKQHGRKVIASHRTDMTCSLPKSTSKTTSLRRGKKALPVQFQAAPVGLAEDWWSSLQAEFDSIQTPPGYDQFDGRRYTQYSKSAGGSKWFAAKYVDPFLPRLVPAPLFVAYGFTPGVGLADFLERMKTVRIVRATSGHIWIVANLKEQAEVYFFQFSAAHKLVIASGGSARGLSLDELEKRVRSLGKGDSAEKWSELISYRRVLQWKAVEGYPVIPVAAESMIYGNRASSDGRSGRSTAALYRVLAVGRPKKGVSFDLPPELKGQTIDVLDKLLETFERIHPDGRVEKLGNIDSSRSGKKIAPLDWSQADDTNWPRVLQLGLLALGLALVVLGLVVAIWRRRERGRASA